MGTRFSPRAKETCRAALAYLTPADLEFCALNLGVQIELCRAEAGLGNLPVAEAKLRELIDAHGPGGNPLTIGALHEALAEIAALRGDEAAFAESLAEVARWFRDTKNPALVARHERLARVALFGSSQATEENSARRGSSRPPRMMTVVHRLRHGGDHTPAGNADWALKQLSAFTGSKEGYLFLAEGAGLSCVAQIGESGDEGIVTEWVRDRLAAFAKDEEEETCTAVTVGELTRLEVRQRVYRFTILASPRGSRDGILGVVVLEGSAVVPFPLLQAISDRLAFGQNVSTVEAASLNPST
jgi:hypothetical protein